MKRRKTRRVDVKDLTIGGGEPISIQSMTNLPINDIKSNINQIQRLVDEGVDLVRLAVKNEDSIKYLKKIRTMVSVPLSADIHFNHRIAIMAIKAGIDKIRINPGNISSTNEVNEVVKIAEEFNVPIRIGVNGGSVDRKKYPEVTPQSLVDSAIEHINILEDNNFFNIIVSIKSSDLHQTIVANRLFSTLKDYPLHIGLTEAGYGMSCIVQSSITIGTLLLEGIGDTIRVSMTGDPVNEVKVAKKILESIGMRNPLIRIISCPTCGRTDPNTDILELACNIEEELKSKFYKDLVEMNRTITIAVMGCEVNGPGEALHADVGIAAGRRGTMLLFASGRRLRKILTDNAVESLIEEVEKLIESCRS